MHNPRFQHKKILTACLGFLVMGLNTRGVTVSSVAELATVAANSNQTVVMTPGVYQMEDYLTPAVISATVPDPVMGSAMITFSGTHNTFDLTGVTIQVNTELLNDFGTKVMEFYVTGSSNVIKGLTVTDIGDAPTAKGGQSFVVGGEDNTIQDVTLNMSGSYPYGYGDLLGKGGGSLVAMRKHSGMLITGLNINILDCTIYSASFGHLFFIQGGRNVLFENCYAEAVTRTTDAMLAETSGPAFDVDFAAVYANYEGEKVITPGYTKSLSECGFRNYGSGGSEGHATGAMTFVNCRAKDCRIGFALTRIDGEILVQDCEATGCEGGYNITGVTVENSRGDVVNGPLLYINPGDLCTVDLALMPATNTTTVHAIACIPDYDHVVTLRKWADMTRGQMHSILVGSSRPAGTNPFSPLGTKTTSGITLNNYTEMPVAIGSTVSASTITSDGSVTDNGSGNTVSMVRAMPTPVGHWMFDDGTGSVAADSSGNGNHGTVTTAVWVAGTDGGALDFNGSNASVSLPAAAFSSISDEVTIAMWVFGGSQQPVADTSFSAQGSSGERILNIHLPWSNTNVFWDAGYSGSNYDRIDKPAVDAEFKGTWNHWVFTKNATAGTMTIYLNGELWHSGSGKTRLMTGITDASIGSQLAARYYDGRIDDVRLYDVALSVHEVEALYHNTPAGAYSSMQDVGLPGLDGRASYSQGIYQITAGGSTIGGTADSGYFLSSPLSGDREIVTQVTSVNNTDFYAMAGLMVRETTEAGSKTVFVGVLPNRQAIMTSRSTTGGNSTVHGINGGTTTDKWIKLVRSGDLFSGYYSLDGRSWALISSVTVSMTSDAVAGLVVSANEDTALCRGIFNMVPPAPTNLAAEVVDAAQIDLGWDAATSATAYDLKRSATSDGPYISVAELSATNYSDTGLSAGTSYYYVVRGEYFGVEGEPSMEVAAVPSDVINPDDVYMESVQLATNGSGQVLSLVVPVSGLGHSYQVLSTESLADPNWQGVSGILVGNGGELAIEVPLEGEQTNRFCKLAAWRQ